jgi:hypothetical protein
MDDAASQTEQPFFSRRETKEAIETVATSRRLTILVGAGASAEIGLPTWRELVQRLLVKVGQAEGLDRSSIRAFCDWTISAEGLPAAGSMARAALGNRLSDEMKRLLYDGMPEPLLPGATARAIAQIRELWGDACEIATTNYDVLLEEALKALFPRTRVKSRIDQYDGAPGDVEVRHLHGLLTERRKLGNIVLSEVDYHRMQDPEAWQEGYFRKQLGDSVCLFIGTSVTDPNLLRYLYRYHQKRRVVVVLVRQADDWPGSENPRSPVRTARERVAMLRWQEMGVTAVYADFYNQSAQLLWEVARRRKLGRSYESYGTRIDRWYKYVNQDVIRFDEPAAFAARQDELQQQARSWLDTVINHIEQFTNIERAERLAVHLWVRIPFKRALVMAVSSDRAWRDPRVPDPKKISLPSNWAAVHAFCRGVPCVWNVERLPSRWGYIRAIPVFLEEHPCGRFPIGVVSLASTMPRSRSVLDRLRPELLDALSVYLQENAADLLSPLVEQEQGQVLQ